MAVPTKKELRNRNVKCAGKSVIRDDHHAPILDEDGARQYKPCENWAANGTSWCQKHGGGLAPTIAAAQRRLAHGSEDLVEILERIARDERETASDRIKAINSYLDRAGIRAGAEIQLGLPKWQGVLGKLFGTAESDESTEDSPAEPSTQDAAPPAPRKSTRRAVAPKPPAEETKPKRAPRKAARPVAKAFEGFGE